MNPKTPDSQRTVHTITIGFLVIYLITGWQWTVLAAVAVGVAGLFSKYLAGLIHRGWMLLARLLGYVVPNIILTLVFYLVLLPVALLARLFRKEPPVVLDNRADSMFRRVEKTFGKEDFINPW
ncbi:SxtJ family membrane protein [Balneolales bacterium ANBcel1]|nr:SxtJ family membrane protein [Balneolales bacterium ANBcel1]